jgi:hypothetical protein
MVSSEKIYSKDQKAYYGDVSKNTNMDSTKYNIFPKTYLDPKNRYGNNQIYQNDQQPYYGSGHNFKVISNVPKDKIIVPIELKELTYTFADDKNIKSLEDTIHKINGRESLDSISLSGKYMRDPVAYYDPSLQEKKMKSAKILETINKLKEDLNNDIKLNGQVFTEENFSIKTKIQNLANANKEKTNELIADSYYYDVNRNCKIK